MQLSPLSGLGSLPSLTPTRPAAAGGAGGSFGQVLTNVLSAHTQAAQNADQAITNLITGKTTDLHTVTLAAAQADLSFRLILELRNRLTEAYQEVMRTQL
ncbi:MAG: flagellar hook-basal body complex protein FliE [Gemmataceae bacterium]|jgi:flagellar hook-basal body complex protein FliE|nr:flagellar hook-basal body complex protein FliE [Gemmataceae bacterium]